MNEKDNEKLYLLFPSRSSVSPSNFRYVQVSLAITRSYVPEHGVLCEIALCDRIFPIGINGIRGG